MKAPRAGGPRPLRGELEVRQVKKTGPVPVSKASSYALWRGRLSSATSRRWELPGGRLPLGRQGSGARNCLNGRAPDGPGDPVQDLGGGRGADQRRADAGQREGP